MITNQIRAKDEKFIAGTYARSPVVFETGKGAVLTDSEGGSFIDFSSGIGVLSLGQADPAWVDAISRQAARLSHISNLYHTSPMVELAERLISRTGMEKVFLANSGTEANEGAIKAARKYMNTNYPGQRDTILCLKGSFHGRTLAALTATGQPDMHKNFGPLPGGFAFTPANDIAALRENLSENIGAVMIECIQGEGGVIELEESFVAEIATVCKERDILLIADEIQTGVGRTGSFLCSTQYRLSPDIVTLAKGLGGGLPIGAILFGEKTAHTLGKGDHGSTFGGNPICCAGGVAVLDAIDDAFISQVAQKGDYLRGKLESLPGIAAVTGRGLMLGCLLNSPLSAADIVSACLGEGLVLLTAKEKLRLLPPLNITIDELDAGIKIMAKVLERAR